MCSTIEANLIKYLEIDPNPDVNISEVMSTYPLVVNEVVNSYVIPHNSMGVPIKCEQPIVAKVMDGIYIRGIPCRSC